jgi:hypothetical protein
MKGKHVTPSDVQSKEHVGVPVSKEEVHRSAHSDGAT